jgi:hypothetical protein
MEHLGQFLRRSQQSAQREIADERKPASGVVG